MYICESCHEVEPADSGVIYAVELKDATTMGGGKEVVEGPGVFFHAGCYPYGATDHFRRKPKPTSVLHRSPH